MNREQHGTSGLRVECYAGYTADQEPVRFQLCRRWVLVIEILDRWLDPAHRYFKVRGDDGGIYILRHDTASQRWEMTLFDSASRSDTRLSST